MAEGVVVQFGGLVALDHASVYAPPGRLTGLIGPNGAGKTTMFNVCCGFQRADAGTVSLDGNDITRDPPPRRARAGLGRTFQRMELFASMTVAENVALAAEAAHVGDDPLTQLGVLNGSRAVAGEVRDVTERLLDEVGLRAIADRFAGEISTGQGRLVELARALARAPRVLLLDEPSSGLDPGESRAFGKLLQRVVSERNVAVLLVEHDMNLVLSVCEWIHVLDFGKPIMEGSPEQIRSSDEVRAAYLGRQGVA